MSATGHRARSRPPGAPHPDDHVIVLFGATGDLARRKLLPGLFHLAAAGLLPTHYRIVGTAPAEFAMSDAAFREHAHDAVAEFGITKPSGDVWKEFEHALSFGAADPGNAAPLEAAVARAEKEIGGPSRRLFHLAIPPDACRPVVALLGATGLADGSRVIAEKPFGTDLASARALNDAFHAVFDESQIFRIDHFLGKESVDNILALRFANGLFEPSWNRDHIAYVQIDVPETLSIEGRAAFYEDTGAFRDMIVTHLFQVLGIVAMEPPTNLSAKALRDEKAKVFDAMAPVDVAHVVRGQYDGYRDEPGVDPASQTETFVALRVEVDNWRWNGVPFVLRTGKNLRAGRQVIVLGFREPTLRMFEVDPVLATAGRGNELVIDFSDPGSIQARFLAKEPGPNMRLGGACMEFTYADSFTAANDLEGYERLILDAMLGDQSLFTRSDGIERLWEVSAPLLEAPPPVEPYAPGSWGPATIDQLTAPLTAGTSVAAPEPTAGLPVRMVLSDVDGTLVTPDKELTPRTIAAVRALAEAGIVFAVTSGRPPRGMAMLVDPLHLTTPISAFNGGMLVDVGMNVISQHEVPVHVIEPVIDRIEGAGVDVWVYRGADWLVRDAAGAHVAREAATVRFDPTVVASFAHVTSDVTKIVGVSDDATRLDAVTADVATTFGDHVSAAQSQPYYLDVTNPRANKGTVARSLARRFDIPPAAMATLGDMPNDMLMFAETGTSIAMGNAEPHVQEAATYVTAANDEDGFADAVERFILGRAR